MDKVVSKETLLRQVDGLRDLARRARRLAEITNEPEQTRLTQCAADLEESARWKATPQAPRRASCLCRRRKGPRFERPAGTPAKEKAPMSGAVGRPADVAGRSWWRRRSEPAPIVFGVSRCAIIRPCLASSASAASAP